MAFKTDLTIYGKSLLVKALGVSQLVYVASMLTVPEALIKTVQNNLFAFLWNNRKDKIKRMVMYQPLEYGGINFMHFNTLVKSLRLAWIGRLLGDSDDKWLRWPILSSKMQLQCRSLKPLFTCTSLLSRTCPIFPRFKKYNQYLIQMENSFFGRTSQ